jgi:hypothetical protein
VSRDLAPWCAAIALALAVTGAAGAREGAEEEAAGHDPSYVAARLAITERRAHEYIGEAYLLAGDLVRAEDHLRRLIRLCESSCEERDDLQQAIETYRKKSRSDTPAPASR